jgi:N-acetylmuramoyl-L-alanine amidase
MIIQKNQTRSHEVAKKDSKIFSVSFATLWLCVGLVFFSCLCPVAAEDSVGLKYTYRPDQVQVTVLHDIKGKAYLPLMDVAQFYGVQVTFDSQTRRITLVKGKSQVKLALSQSVFLTVDPVGSFPIDPVEVVSGQLGILPESAEDLLGAILNVSVRYLPEQQSLVAGGIRADEIRKEILAEAQQPKSPVETPTPPPAIVQALAPTPTPEQAAEATEEKDDEQAPPLPPAMKEEKEPSAKQIYQVRRIVIDAGHGGQDAGAKGYDKRYVEKQATLDIAKKVVELLKQEPGLDVLMTRTGDYFITLKYRTEFANRHNADLFVSIHCNANPRSLATGTETYVYSARPSNKLAAVAAVSENQGRNDLVSWFAELHHKKYDDLSYTLARKVDDRISVRLNQHIRQPQHAPFYVLRQVDMPSILIETAFISNKNEEIKLRDPYWRDKIAKAIADGILAYKDQVEASIENQQARR